MGLSAGAMVAAAALFAATAPASAQDRETEVGQIVFDLCPKVLDGSISLSDPAQVMAQGFTPMAPRETPGGKNPRTTMQSTGLVPLFLAKEYRRCRLTSQPDMVN